MDISMIFFSEGMGLVPIRWKHLESYINCGEGRWELWILLSYFIFEDFPFFLVPPLSHSDFFFFCATTRVISLVLGPT